MIQKTNVEGQCSPSGVTTLSMCIALSRHKRHLHCECAWHQIERYVVNSGMTLACPLLRELLESGYD